MGLAVRVVDALQSGAPPPAHAELCRVKTVPRAKFTYCGLQTRFRLSYWKNYPPLISIAIEFAQLMSLSVRSLYVRNPPPPTRFAG